MDKGVSIDEIKLYGQTEIDEALEDLSNDGNFMELESGLAKVSQYFLCTTFKRKLILLVYILLQPNYKTLRAF